MKNKTSVLFCFFSFSLAALNTRGEAFSRGDNQQKKKQSLRFVSDSNEEKKSDKVRKKQKRKNDA